jgi:hypothetical protein
MDSLLNEGIATLASGKKYRAFFDMSFRRNEERPDLPMNHTARGALHRREAEAIV